MKLMVSMVALGGEMAGHCACAIFARPSKNGRIDCAFPRLAASGAIAVAGLSDQRMLRRTEEGRRFALGGADRPAAASVPPAAKDTPLCGNGQFCDTIVS